MTDEEREQCPVCGSFDTEYTGDDWALDEEAEDEIHVNNYQCRACKAYFDDRGWYWFDHEIRSDK